MNIRNLDKLLTEIHNTKNYQFETFRKNEQEIEYRKEINYLLDELKLIRKPFSNSSILELTQFGNKVMDKGGWISYCQNEEKKESENEKRKIELEKAELENLQSITILNKWLLKSKWWPHIISGISIFIAIIFGSLSIYTSDKNSKLEEDFNKMNTTIEKKTENQKNKPKIISNQTLKITKDSLNK